MFWFKVKPMSCVAWTGYSDGNQYFNYENSCYVPMQFTLQWPTGRQTYRIASRGLHLVPVEGSAEPTILSEAPAAFGLGPPGEVTPSVSSTLPGITRLTLHNAHDFYALVKVVVWHFPGSGPSHNTATFFNVIAPHQDTFALDIPLETPGAHYEIQPIEAEDDPARV